MPPRAAAPPAAAAAAAAAPAAADETAAAAAAPAAAASLGPRLGADFCARPVLEVARDLLGCVLRHGDTAGRIVETEAYHASEPACHAYVGLTPRTRVLFGPPGRAYVYRSYGIHALFNVVCEQDGIGAAVLIRALEPVDGVELMRARRPLARRDVDLCNGPGKLTEALAITLDHHDADLATGPIALHARPQSPPTEAGLRIGITKAPDLHWRFMIAGSRWVSRPWPPGFGRRVALAERSHGA